MKKTVFRRTMSVSESDFIRLLPLAFPDKNVTITYGIAESRINGKHIRIEFTPLPERQLGQLSLPMLSIGFEFEGYDASQIADFMEGFDRCFHRGGG